MKLKSFSTVLITLVIALSLAGCDSSSSNKTSPGSDLRLNFKVGEIYTITATIDQDITQEIPQVPSPLNFHQTLQLGLNCLVKSVQTNGDYGMDVTYHNLVYKITGLPEPIEFDSSVADNKDFPLAGLVGKTYHMVLSPTGKVLEVNGADQIVDSLVDSMQAPAEVKAVLSKDALKNQFGDKATKEMMTTFIGSFPDHPVKDGDHWQQEMNLKYGYPVKVNVEYTLEKTLNQIATLDVKVIRTPLPDAPAMTVGNISFSYELSGEDKGKIDVDLKTGWITTGKVDSKLGGKVIVAPTQELPEGLTWPISVTGTIALKGQGPLSQ